MSITLLPNQAFAEVVTDPNACYDNNFVQLVQRGDYISLQGFATILPQRATAVDFDDWTLGFGWSNPESGVLLYDASQGDITSALSPLLGLQKNRAYVLYVSVVVNDPGDTDETEGVLIKLNGENMKLPLTTLGNGRNTTFNLAIYYVPTTITTDKIDITFDNPTINFNVTALGLFEYSYPMLEAFDSAGVLLQTITPTTSKFYKDEVVGVVPPIRWEAKFLLDVLDNGCYYLKLKDGVSNFLNGNFVNSSDWVLDTNWAISGGKANFSGIPNESAITAKVELLNGFNYTLQFLKEGVESLVMTITYFGGGTTTHTFTGSGVQTFSFTASGATGLASIEFNLPTGFIPVVMSVSAMLLQYNDAGVTMYGFLLADSHSHTVYFSATNNDSAFGFDYSTGFTQTLRVYARQDVTSYPEEAETYTFSDNSETLLFGRTQKEHTIFVGDAAVYIHDCLRLLRLHDTFLIDSSPYVISGGYDLNRRKTSALKQAVFVVKEKQGVGSNYRLS